MPVTQKWSLHDYLSDRNEGLHSKLELSQSQVAFLKSLRKQARIRIREAFNEVQRVLRTIKKLTPEDTTKAELRRQIKAQKSLRHVSDNILDTLVGLASNLTDNQLQALLDITPKFRTQGSFEYETLNVPYRKPPQEMDIDDGVYFPMQMFEDAPALAHSLMITLVDSALQSLANENTGWDFDNSKPTCARIHVAAENVHLDVPMYAIPEEQYIQITESIFDSASVVKGFYTSSDVWFSENALLDRDSVLLARRDRDKWQKSDPQVVQRWFIESVQEIGEHLRLACRILKSWRDAIWINGGGPSSIALMKCAVDTLGQSFLDGKDIGLVMQTIARNLPEQLTNGVDSPDPSDERPLFPHHSDHNDAQKDIVEAATEFNLSFQDALNAPTKAEASQHLRSIFGERGINSSLITSVLAAPVYRQPAKRSKPTKIEETMKSG